MLIIETICFLSYLYVVHETKYAEMLKTLCLYLDAFIIGNTLNSMCDILNEIPLQNEWQH